MVLFVDHTMALKLTVELVVMVLTVELVVMVLKVELVVMVVRVHEASGNGVKASEPSDVICTGLTSEVTAALARN